MGVLAAIVQHVGTCDKSILGRLTAVSLLESGAWKEGHAKRVCTAVPDFAFLSTLKSQDPNAPFRKPCTSCSPFVSTMEVPEAVTEHLVCASDSSMAGCGWAGSSLTARPFQLVCEVWSLGWHRSSYMRVCDVELVCWLFFFSIQAEQSPVMFLKFLSREKLGNWVECQKQTKLI